MSDSEAFRVDVDFTSAVQQFEKYTRKMTENATAVDKLVTAAQEYEKAQADSLETLRLIELAEKKFGVSLDSLKLPQRTTEAYKYANALGQIEVNLVKINKIKNSGGVPGFGADAASFGGRKPRKSNSVGTAVDDILFLLSGGQAGPDPVAMTKRLQAQAVALERARAAQAARINTTPQGQLFSDADRRRNALNAARTPRQNGDPLAFANPFEEQANGGRRGDIGNELALSARYFLLYRTFSAVRDVIDDAARASVEFVRGIGEIQTITQKSTHTFEDFKKEILAVSNIFGFKVEDVTQATYQAISNQVVDAAHSFQFLAESAQFAKVTASTLTQAVDLGSSAINSYGLSAEDANQVFASLFKTIELGRVKAEQIAESFGNVAVLGKQVGVSFDELGAALATLTVSGVTPANAMTFLRNVLIKLVKPTEDMSKFLTDIGFGSGEAAVKTLTFTGVLEKLFEKTQGSTAVTGELLSNIRAIQGAVALSKNGVADFTETLGKFKDKVGEYNTAKGITNANDAQKLAVQINEVRNSFVNLGVDAVKGLESIIPSANALKIIIGVIVLGLGGLAAGFISSAIGARLLAVNAAGANVALNGLRAHPLILALTLITGAYLALRESQNAFSEESLKNGVKALEQYKETLDKELAPKLEAIDKQYQNLGKTLAEQRVVATRNIEAQTAAVEKLKDATTRAFEKEAEQLNHSIALRNAQITKGLELQHKAGESAKKEREQFSQENFEREQATRTQIEQARNLRLEGLKNQENARVKILEGKERELAGGDARIAFEDARKFAETATKNFEDAKKLAEPLLKDAKDRLKNTDIGDSVGRLKASAEVTALEKILGPEAKNTAELNQLLTKRERIAKDVERVQNRFSRFGGEGSKEQLRGLIVDLQTIDNQITKARGGKRAGQPDSLEQIAIKARQVQLGVETDISNIVAQRVKTLEAETSLIQKQLDLVKEKRDAEHDNSTLSGKETPEELRKKSAALISSTYDSRLSPETKNAIIQQAVGIQTLADKKERELKIDEKALKINNEKDKKVDTLKGGVNSSVNQRELDQRAIQLLAGNGLGFRDTINIGNLGGIFKVARNKQTAINAGTPGIGLSPAERLEVGKTLLEYYKNLNGTGKGRGTLPLGGVGEDLAPILRQAQQILGPNIRADAQKKQDEYFLKLLLGKFYSGDSKAGGGYSVGGGIHHPGEFIINANQTKKYRAELDRLNKASNTSTNTGFIDDPGNKQYRDFHDILSPFANTFVSGQPYFFQNLDAETKRQLTRALSLQIQNFLPSNELSFRQQPTLAADSLSLLRSNLVSPFGSSTPTPRTFQFGNINISLSSIGASTRDIADGIRRDVQRQLSTLS